MSFLQRNRYGLRWTLFCPNLWAPTAGLLQVLTVLQQCVY